MNKLSLIEIADTFAALGHPKRIKVLEFMLDKLPADATFGEIQKHTAIAASTLTHHLREMENGHILVREPEGTSTRLRLKLHHLQNILAELMHKCCENETGNTND